jgi:site-specific DNA-methyltransferase (adenine-specific)
MLELNTVHRGDCLEVMKLIDDKSIDMILCDLPYGTTACKWDAVIPFEPLWEQYKRISKDHAAIVLTGSQPFTSALVMSNVRWFKYCWVWYKNNPTGFHFAKTQPMRSYEDIAIFSFGRNKFNPIKRRSRITRNINGSMNCRNIYREKAGGMYEGMVRYPHVVNEICFPWNVVEFDVVPRATGTLHPTQKPVSLFEYLIRTYTDEGDCVLDNCAGSGTTGIACLNTNRRFILIEKDPHYCEVARKRIEQHQIGYSPEKVKDQTLFEAVL